MSAVKRIRVVDGNVGTSVVHDRKKESRTQSGGARSSRREDSREKGGTRSSRANRRPPARSRDDPLDADRSSPQINYNRRRSIYLLFFAFFPSGAAARCPKVGETRRASLARSSPLRRFATAFPNERPPGMGLTSEFSKLESETRGIFYFILVSRYELKSNKVQTKK